MLNNPHTKHDRDIDKYPVATAMIRFVVLVFIFYCVVGITTYPFAKWDESVHERKVISSTIKGVRLVTDTKTDTQSTGGHPVAGAILGGLATGDILGAGAGAILGSEIGSQKIQQAKKVIQGCYVTAEVNNMVVFSQYFEYFYSDFCNVIRRGDNLNLIKVTTKSNGSSKYIFDDSINPHFFN